MQKALVIFFAVSCLLLQIKGDVWHYPNEEKNGQLADNENWGGKCSTGNRQSPIDLVKDVAVYGRFTGFQFQNYDSPMKSPIIVNNGHSIQVSTTPGAITVSGGGLPSTYIFDQMHFHWASEHTINGGRFALELHMVHHEKSIESLNKATEEKKGIAVLGILFHITETPNPMIEKLLVNSGNIFNTTGQNISYKEKLLLSDFLPNRLESFFRYDGSLTTPGCGEAVVWTVFEKSIGISSDQLERFKNVHDTEGHELTHNYRHLQPLNSRNLIYVQDEMFISTLPGSTRFGYRQADFNGAFAPSSMSFMMFSCIMIVFINQIDWI